MRPEEIQDEEGENLNEGVLRSIVRSIFLRHRLRSKADDHAKEDSVEPEETHE